VEYRVEVWFEGEVTPETLQKVTAHRFFEQVAVSDDSTAAVLLTKFAVAVDAYTANDALNHVTAEILAALAPSDFEGFLRKTTVTLV
jgi:hypothetical protein